MSAYDAGDWSDFGVALVGAAAALVGLLFVAVSINLERIVAYPTLPARAGSALILFTLPLTLGIWVLVPEQPRAALGAELIGTGVVLGAMLVPLSRPRSEEEPPPSWVLTRRLPAVVTPVLVVLAGTTVIAEAGGGLYWLPAAVLIAFFSGLSSAWVLLIEILR